MLARILLKLEKSQPPCELANLGFRFYRVVWVGTVDVTVLRQHLDGHSARLQGMCASLFSSH